MNKYCNYDVNLLRLEYKLFGITEFYRLRKLVSINLGIFVLNTGCDALLVRLYDTVSGSRVQAGPIVARQFHYHDRLSNVWPAPPLYLRTVPSEQFTCTEHVLRCHVNYIVLYYIILYIISCNVMSYYISHHIIECHVVKLYIILYHVMSYYILYHIISYHTISYHVMSCHVMLYVTLCYMLCCYIYNIIYHVM